MAGGARAAARGAGARRAAGARGGLAAAAAAQAPELVLRPDGRVVPAGAGGAAGTKKSPAAGRRAATPPKTDNALKRLFSSAGASAKAKTKEGKPAAPPVQSKKKEKGTTRLKQAAPPTARPAGQKKGQGKPAGPGYRNNKPALPLPAKRAPALQDLQVSEDAGRTTATRALESSTFAAVTCFIAYPFVPEDVRGGLLALALFGVLSQGGADSYPEVKRGGAKISPGGMKFMRAGGNYGKAFGVNKKENTEGDNFAGRVLLGGLVLIAFVLSRQSGAVEANPGEIFLPLAVCILLLRGNSTEKARFSNNNNYGEKWKSKFWDGKELPAAEQTKGALPASAGEGGAKAAEAGVPANVAEARQWIADWEAKKGGDASSAPPANVVEAQKWIADWKERSGGD